MVSCPASPTPRNWLGAPAIHARPSRAASADATRPLWSSTSAASPGSRRNPPGPGVRQPAWVRNPHNAAAGAPEFSAPSGPAACGSMVGRAVREPGNDLLVGEGGAASSAPGGRLFSAAGPRLFASDASVVSRATPSSGPVLVGSKRFAPFPWGPRPSMKADISTLHKPDILTLQRQRAGRGLNGGAGGGRLAAAVASTSRADVRCELPFAIHGRYRNKTRSQAGCRSASLGIGAPAFAGTGRRARHGRTGGARDEGASGARTGFRQPGARGIDVAAGRCVRRAFAGSRGGRGGHGAGLGGRDPAKGNGRGREGRRSSGPCGACRGGAFLCVLVGCAGFDFGCRRCFVAGDSPGH